MSEPIPPSAINVLCGLTGDGLTRIEEAEKTHRDDPAALAALLAVKAQVAAGESFACECDECETWDGVHRRCTCGNRRVYWLWEGGYWRSEVY